MKKTKAVDGKEYPASAFAYVGDPQDISTWHLPVFDEAHVRDALSRFNQTDLPAAAKARVARKLARLAKKYGIDASGFAKEYATKQAAADMSFDEIRAAIQDALRDQFGSDAYGSPAYLVCEVYPGYLIARGPNEELYRIDYAVGDPDEDGDNDITLGDPQAVEVAYVPVSESARFIVSEAAVDDDWTFPVVVMESGFARGAIEDPKSGQPMTGVPHYFTPEVVAQVAEAVNGARFGRRHPEEGMGADDPERIAGWLDGGQLVGKEAQANIHLLKSETELHAKLSAARQAKKLDMFGVSVLGLFGFKLDTVNGKKALVSTKLAKLASVDLCAEAGAGGRFLNPMRVAASADSMAELAELQRRAIKPKPQTGSSEARRQLGAQMKEKILLVLAALAVNNAGRADELTKKFNGLKEEQHAEFLLEVSEAAIASVPKQNKTNATEGQPTTEEILATAKEALAEAKKIQSKNLVERKLGESKLPQPAIALVREHLKDQIVDEAAVDGEIKRVREAFAAFTEVGKVNGSTLVVGGRDSQDKIVLAVEGMFGVKEALKSGVKPFRGIQEAYKVITGDLDLSQVQGGGLYKVTQAIATTDFPNILLNSMTKRLIQDYAEVGMGGLEKIVGTPANIADFKSNDRVRMGYLGDLPTVAEAAAYTELTKPTDEKISYVVQKRGGLLTISYETIKNDDLGKIAQFPTRLARAGRRTLKQFVTSLFTANAAYDPDSVAIFNAAHNNLTVNALSSANMDASELQLLNQSEKDSNKPLNLPLQWLMVPPALKATAYQINNNMSGTNNWFGRLGSNPQAPENLIVNELLTASSTTRWYTGCFPSEAPALEIGYLDGIEEPQILLASDLTTGLRFTNDQIQYKAVFIFGGKFIDFRPVTQNN